MLALAALVAMPFPHAQGQTTRILSHLFQAFVCGGVYFCVPLYSPVLIIASTEYLQKQVELVGALLVHLTEA